MHYEYLPRYLRPFRYGTQIVTTYNTASGVNPFVATSVGPYFLASTNIPFGPFAFSGTPGPTTRFMIIYVVTSNPAITVGLCPPGWTAHPALGVPPQSQQFFYKRVTTGDVNDSGTMVIPNTGHTWVLQMEWRIFTNNDPFINVDTTYRAGSLFNTIKPKIVDTKTHTCVHFHFLTCISAKQLHAPVPTPLNNPAKTNINFAVRADTDFSGGKALRGLLYYTSISRENRHFEDDFEYVVGDYAGLDTLHYLSVTLNPGNDFLPNAFGYNN